MYNIYLFIVKETISLSRSFRIDLQHHRSLSMEDGELGIFIDKEGTKWAEESHLEIESEFSRPIEHCSCSYSFFV